MVNVRSLLASVNLKGIGIGEGGERRGGGGP